MTKTKFWVGLGVCLVALAALGQAIKWYNDAAIPQKTVMDGAEVMSIQQTGPNAYRWALLSDVREYMAGEAGGPITIIYATTINVTTNYTTNAFITTLTVVSNAYFNETNFVNYEIVTNLTVVNTYKGNINFTTNLFLLTARAEDIAWDGPTNTVDFSLGSLQNYTTFTPFSVTNVIGETNGYGNSVLLCVSNAATTNVTFTPPTGWKIGVGDSVTLTNTDIMEVWFLSATSRKTIATKAFH